MLELYRRPILQQFSSWCLALAVLVTALPASASITKTKKAYRWVNKSATPANDFHFRMSRHGSTQTHMRRAQFLNFATGELFLPHQDWGEDGVTAWNSPPSTTTPIPEGGAITIVEETVETPDAHMIPLRDSSYFTNDNVKLLTTRYFSHPTWNEIEKTFGIDNIGAPGDPSYRLTDITVRTNASASGLSDPGLFQPSDGTVVYSQAGPITLAPGDGLTIPVGPVTGGKACVLDFQAAETTSPSDHGPMQFAFEEGVTAAPVPTWRIAILAMFVGLALLGAVYVRRALGSRA